MLCEGREKKWENGGVLGKVSSSKMNIMGTGVGKGTRNGAVSSWFLQINSMGNGEWKSEEWKIAYCCEDDTPLCVGVFRYRQVNLAEFYRRAPHTRIV
jgi:hypothetical protein